MIAHLSPMCQGQISFQKTYKWAMETKGQKSNSSELLRLSWLPAILMIIRSKMNKLAWRHHFPITSLWGNVLDLKGNFLPSQWSNLAEIRDFMHVLLTRKYKKNRIKNNREKVWRHHFPRYKSMGGFLLPWEPEFWSNLPQNLIQPFPHPNDATCKIWSRLANWLQRYSSSNVKFSSLKGK